MCKFCEHLKTEGNYGDPLAFYQFNSDDGKSVLINRLHMMVNEKHNPVLLMETTESQEGSNEVISDDIVINFCPFCGKQL